MKRLLTVALALTFAALMFAPASAQVYKDNGQAGANGLCSAIALGFPVGCAPQVGDKAFEVSVTNTLTQFIAAPTTGAIHFTFVQYAAIESATGGALEIEVGTGTNCASNASVLTSLTYMATTGNVSGSYGNGNGAVFIAPVGYAACAVLAGTVTSAIVSGTYNVN